MGQAAASAYVTLEDYFEAEVDASHDAPRREWSDGVVYSMSRGTPEHARLIARATTLLARALPPGCQAYASDLMLFVASANLSTYADLSVVCGPLETVTVRKAGRSLGQAVTNPTLLLEVLSESTERYDRDGKFQAYKQIASLCDYIRVSQDKRRIETFRRVDDWSGEVAGSGQALHVQGVDLEIDELYATG